eukprot:Sspe_Gene.87119::Locus_58044_Transcript_1_1_Confidence_1.000_Length_1195::g.87119::m.87119
MDLSIKGDFSIGGSSITSPAGASETASSTLHESKKSLLLPRNTSPTPTTTLPLKSSVTRPRIPSSPSPPPPDHPDDDTSLGDSTAAPLSIWQVVLKAGAEKKDGRFGAIRAAIMARTEELAHRLRMNYKSKALEKKLNRLDALGEAKGTRYEKVKEGLKKAIEQHGIICEISDESPDTKVTYRLQGNIDMYSNENQQRRKRNRRHVKVQAVLDKWWNLLPKGEGDVITKHIYQWLGRKLFHSFVPYSTDKECEMCIKQDWRNDSKGAKEMDKDLFCDAMFQFADIWCETTETQEYVDLLNACIKITKGPPAYTPPTEVESSDDEIAAPPPQPAVDNGGQQGEGPRRGSAGRGAERRRSRGDDGKGGYTGEGN